MLALLGVLPSGRAGPRAAHRREVVLLTATGTSTTSWPTTSRRGSRRRPTDGAAAVVDRAQHAGRQPGRDPADHRPRSSRPTCPSIVWVAPAGRPRGERRHVHHARREPRRTWRPGRTSARRRRCPARARTSRARSARRSRTTRSPTSPSIAEARGRTVDWAVSTVDEARSPTPASEAVAAGAVDGIAASLDEVARAGRRPGGDGRRRTVTLDLADAAVDRPRR